MLKKTYLALFCAGFCANNLFAGDTDIVINELLPNPGGTDTNKEWFEVHNKGNTAVDLLNWEILGANETLDHTIATSAIVPAGGYLVLGQSSDTVANGGVNVGYVYTTVNLNNSNTDKLILKNASGVEIDRVEWVNIMPATGATSGYTKELIDPSLDNNLGTSWADATTQWAGVDYGTPGNPNSTMVSCAAGTGNAKATQIIFDSNSGTSISFDFSGIATLNYGTITVTIPGNWSWSGSASNVSLSGGISAGTKSVNGSVITITGFSVPGDNLGSVTISSLTTPNISNVEVSSFGFATGGNTGSGCETPVAIASAKVWVVGSVTDIVDIQEDAVDGCSSVMETDTLAVSGIVTVENGVFKTTGLDIYLEDATAGINIFAAAGDLFYDRGDEALFIGVVTTYNGKTELVYLAGEVLSTNNAIPVEEVSIADINEDYEGKLVYIVDVDTTGFVGTIGGSVVSWAVPFASGSGVNVQITDGTDFGIIRIDGDTDMIGTNFLPTFPTTIAGVIAQFDGVANCDSGYSIQPRDAQDMDFMVSVKENPNSIVKNYSLNQNYPNPFNPNTQITFELPKSTKVNLEVYNLLGQKVVTLVNRKFEAGNHSVTFIANNLASGIYFYKLSTPDFTQTKKMLLVK
ncbi:lamin tail domain-containing protein [bacterium]|nr:lamin tail domain-containing protein [bacterium]